MQYNNLKREVGINKAYLKEQICEFCNYSFSSFRVLGNHIRWKHPNMSRKYRRMIEVRREREIDREALKMAKFHSERIGND